MARPDIEKILDKIRAVLEQGIPVDAMRYSLPNGGMRSIERQAAYCEKCNKRFSIPPRKRHYITFADGSEEVCHSCNPATASIGKMPDHQSNDMQQAKAVIDTINEMECSCRSGPQEISFNKVLVGKQQCYKCKKWNLIYG